MEQFNIEVNRLENLPQNEDQVDTVLENISETKEGADFASPEQMKKIEEVFNFCSELEKIGTKEQYKKYLENIFPESSLKDIVYHGTNNKSKILNEGFDEKIQHPNYQSWRYYFTNDIETATNKADSKNIKDILFAVLNNPKIVRKITTPGSAFVSLNYGVAETNQIHILGSKEDILGFSEFVDNE